MNRPRCPCLCDRYRKGQPYDLTQCRVCWLYANDRRYRELWGGCHLPWWARRAKNFLRALAVHAWQFFPTADHREQWRRSLVCKGCTLYVAAKDECQHPDCGCVMRRKARWKSAGCPLSKW